MRFIDEAKIELKAGDGGNGCISFYRGANVPKGGPDGGDGGRGGSIYFEASKDLQSLLDYRYSSRYQAEAGKKGMGKQMNGRAGKDLTLKVPQGTVVKNIDGDILADLVEDGQRVLMAKGGTGGIGNIHFKTSTRQAPRIAIPGAIGEEFKVFLELRSLSEVGLVGFPNAGKSSLLRSLSGAQPKVGAYPFTTLRPHLGVVNSDLRFVMADIPGLITGAHKNEGLGHRFLKHISRSQSLLYLLQLDIEQNCSLWKQFEDLRHELRMFDPMLCEKSFLVAINKIDLLESPELTADQLELLKSDLTSFEEGFPHVVKISAKQHIGLDQLVNKLEELIAPPNKAVISC